MPPIRLLKRLRITLRNKTLCQTTNGEFILVHGDPKVGDYVFLARGAAFPIITRPTKKDKPYCGIKNPFRFRRFTDMWAVLMYTAKQTVSP